MRPRLDIALAVFVAVILAAFLAIVSLGGSSSHTPSATLAVPGQSNLDGAALPAGVTAPPFALTDQHGRHVSLGEERGHVTVLTFLYSTCGASCVVIAQQIRGALDELAHPVPVLIVSADPAMDTPSRVRRFLAQVSLSDRVRYLTGSASQLRQVWREYGVTPAGAGKRQFARFAKVLLLDGQGRERDLFEQEQLTPESLSHDIRTLE